MKEMRVIITIICFVIGVLFSRSCRHENEINAIQELNSVDTTSAITPNY